MAFSVIRDDSKYFNLYGNYDSVGAYQSKESEYFDWYKFRSFPDDYACWWGIKILPEIDEENEKYLEYITGRNGILRKWLKAGASGWRLDVADELPDVFLDRLRKAIKEENKDAYILGEVWEDASNKMSYSQRRRYLLTKSEFVKPLNEYKDEITIFCQKYIDCDALLCSMTILENEVSIFKKVGYKPVTFMKIFNIPEKMKKELKSSNFVANYLKFIVKPMIIDYCEQNLINKGSYKLGITDIYEKNGYINFDVHFAINLKELDSKKLLDVELAIAELNEIVGEDVLKKE